MNSMMNSRKMSLEKLIRKMRKLKKLLKLANLNKKTKRVLVQVQMKKKQTQLSQKKT